MTDLKLTQSGLPTQRVDVLTVAEIDEHRGQTFADVLTQVRVLQWCRPDQVSANR
ncbi:MAG: hypothetical protein IPI24_07295 [Ignavibacteria bacterium]|nr:hypothetical protein [Ignavibacteria bacterium]